MLVSIDTAIHMRSGHVYGTLPDFGYREQEPVRRE